MIGKLLYPAIEELIEQKDFRTIKEQLSELPEADLADLLEDLGESRLMVVFRLLSKEKAADVFEHLDLDQQRALLDSLSREQVKEILEEMSVDDRTQLLDELPPDVASRLLELLSHRDRELARTILNYPEDSVGRLITPDYVSLPPDVTVGQALERIRIFGKDMETVYSCYVIGRHRKLLGYVSLRKLVTCPLDTKIEDIYQRHFIWAGADTPQEEAVEMLRRYDLLALPVLDSEGSMVGIVTFDDLMDVAEEEYREDIDRLAALVPGDEPFLEEPVLSLVRRRTPWLMGLLVVQAVAVLILAAYEAQLEAVIALTFFLPALVATGGNTGTQSASLVIRALATGEVTIKDVGRIFFRGVQGGLLLAVILGLCGWLMAIVIHGDPMIGMCVGLGLAAVVLMANLAGSLLPLLLKKLNLDPAIMSAPFISTLTDIFGLVLYIEISRQILGI